MPSSTLLAPRGPGSNGVGAHENTLFRDGTRFANGQDNRNEFLVVAATCTPGALDGVGDCV